jgi:hypothetical protein
LLLCCPQIQQLEDRLRSAESTAAAAAAASSASGPGQNAAAAAAAEERVVAMQQQLAAAKTQVCVATVYSCADTGSTTRGCQGVSSKQ